MSFSTRKDLSLNIKLYFTHSFKENMRYTFWTIVGKFVLSAIIDANSHDFFTFYFLVFIRIVCLDWEIYVRLFCVGRLTIIDLRLWHFSLHMIHFCLSIISEIFFSKDQKISEANYLFLISSKKRTKILF